MKLLIRRVTVLLFLFYFLRLIGQAATVAVTVGNGSLQPGTTTGFNVSSGTVKNFYSSTTTITNLVASNLPVSVKSYGAVGNGTTDDTAALQAALDAAGPHGTVILKSSDTYYITSTLTPYDYQTILGYGAKLKTTATSDFMMMRLNSLTGVVIKGLHFFGNSIGQDVTPGVQGIYAYRSKNCEIDSCIFEDLNYCIHWAEDGAGGDATNPSRNKIHDNTFKNAWGGTNGAYGVLLVRSSDTVVADNIFSPGPFMRHAVYISAGTRHSVVNGNVIENCRLAGIAMNSGTTATDRIYENVISNNVVVGQESFLSSSYAITVSGQIERSIISNNIIVNSSEAGIYLQANNSTMYPSHNLISGNIIENPAGIGIQVFDGTYNHIIGNTIKDARGSSDINIAQSAVTGGGSYNVIESNLFWTHPTDPVTYHCTFSANTTGNLYQNNSSSGTVTVKNDLGTDNIWHYEIFGSTSWNPANLGDGVGETSPNISVPGIAVGMSVDVYPPYNTQGLLITGYRLSTDVAAIRIQNETGGSVDLATGTWKVRAYE